MIQTITAYDRNGMAQTFEVSCEEYDSEGYTCYYFEIQHPSAKTSKKFSFEVTRISDDKMMIR